MASLFILALITSIYGVCSSTVESPKYWLTLQFSSDYPIADLMIRDHPLAQYGRNDRKGIQRLSMDQVPDEWILEVGSDQTAEHASLMLTPSWQSQNVRFNLRERVYDLKYTIGCKFGFYGKSCDTMCISDPEQDHFNCSSKGEKVCHDGWTGKNCDKRIDACTSSPCQNGGKCHLAESTPFTCSCPRGFEGFLCENRRPPTAQESILPVLEVCLLVVSISSALLLLIALQFFYKKTTRATDDLKKTAPQYTVNPWLIDNMMDVEKGAIV